MFIALEEHSQEWLWYRKTKAQPGVAVVHGVPGRRVDRLRSSVYSTIDLSWRWMVALEEHSRGGGAGRQEHSQEWLWYRKARAQPRVAVVQEGESTAKSGCGTGRREHRREWLWYRKARA
jgi:hypothetical protein